MLENLRNCVYNNNQLNSRNIAEDSPDVNNSLHFDKYNCSHEECEIDGDRSLAQSFAQMAEDRGPILSDVCYYH